MVSVCESEIPKPAPWHEVFALDYRSLAFFRIFLGLTILADLICRLPSLVSMYTDDGVITRYVVWLYYEQFALNNWEYGIWSLHWISGEASLQYALFGVAALAAIALTLGWWTRIATIISWVLLASLHVRNPLILTSGDTILKLVLFWSMFLPLGKIWSLDARNNENKYFVGKRYFSFASAGLILQIILMYFFTGVAKCNEYWFSGDAMEYVLRLDIYILPFGSQMLEYPLLLTLVTYATLFWEVIGIWLLLSWVRNDLARIVVMLAYWSFHIGISMAMSIGLFPFICLMIWLPLLPSRVWQFLLRDSSVTSTTNSIVQDEPKSLRLVVNSFSVVTILFVALLNISNIENRICKQFMPRSIAPLGYWLNLDQRFQMFGRPPSTNPWFVYEATLRDGTKIDIVRSVMKGEDVAVTYERPERVLLSLPNHHWRKLHRNLVNPIRVDFRQSLVDYAVNNWNANHGEERQVVQMRLTCFSEPIGPGYDGVARNGMIWGKYDDPRYSTSTKVDQVLDDILEGDPF